jgi:hypothetical protein
LQGTELEGLQLSVDISDPQRKKERTDVQANQKELYVAGLAKSVTEQDLRKLFEQVRSCFFLRRRRLNVKQFGIVTGIRVAMDDTKAFCRGFAFVDFDTEASLFNGFTRGSYISSGICSCSVGAQQHRTQKAQHVSDYCRFKAGRYESEIKVSGFTLFTMCSK